MATVAQTAPIPSVASWPARFWEDLQPTPGRLGATLRIVLASVITLILLLVWQVPFQSIALYFVFIVGRDNPSVSFRSGLMSMLTIATAVAMEIGLVIFADNDPMARVIGVAVVSFLAGLLVVSTTVPPLASTLGFIFCTLVALWERHAKADSIVKTSLWLIAATGIAVGSSVLVEYLFNSRNPVEQLVKERWTRYGALIDLYKLYAQGADEARLVPARMRVERLAATGQSPLQRLYNTIADRGLDPGSLPVGTRVRIPMLAQLMDISAAFASQNATVSDPDMRQRCAQIASECAALYETAEPRHEGYRPLAPGERLTLLDRVEDILHLMVTMPGDKQSSRDQQLATLPSSKVPLLIPGAWKDRDNIAFGLKISLCATLCYLFYFAVDWPGISTSVTTVLIAGLSTTGAIKQKFTFRLLGALIGGLILGLGSAIFIFPLMDTIAALTVLVTILAFVSAWMAGGRQFSYVGLQVIFSFYLVAFEDAHAPTSLAPPRDRLVGILVALLVMWVVLDRLWPVRTVTAMRRSLASVLRNEAELFRTELGTREHDRLIRATDVLRDHVGKTVAAIRSMNEVVEYEFGVDRQKHIINAEKMLRAALTSVGLLWNELAVLHKEEDADFLVQPSLMKLRGNIAAKLDTLVAHVTQQAPVVLVGPLTLTDEAILTHPRYGEYAQNTVARYRELELIVAGIEMMM